MWIERRRETPRAGEATIICAPKPTMFTPNATERHSSQSRIAARRASRSALTERLFGMRAKRRPI